jgi:hypothetical protein
MFLEAQKMAAIMCRKKQSDHLRVHDALDKGDSPLSEEEIDFIWIYCHILTGSENDKVNHIATMAMTKGRGDPGLTIAAIRKLLDALVSKAEACQRVSLAPYQTTQNSDNLDAYICSLEYLCESTRSLKEAFQQGFVMGIEMAHFSMTKNLKDFRVTLDRTLMATKWNESLQYTWESKGVGKCL